MKRLLLLPLLVLAATATPASAAVRDCRLVVSETQSITSVRDMSCKAAKRDLKGYSGFIKRKFRTPGGFRCKRVAGIAISGEWRCAHRDGRAYRFTFGD
jgi:hypothetical protein